MLRAHWRLWDHDGWRDNEGWRDNGLSFDSYNQPQYTILPTSGTAGNGKPIFSWDQAAAQITRNWPNDGWNASLGTSLTVSYAFRSTAPAQMPEDTGGFGRFTSAQITATEMAFQQWAEVANITFIRAGSGTSGEGAYSNSATILFANYTTGAAGAAAFAFEATPGQTDPSSVAGDVWVNSTLPENQSFNNLEYGAQVLLHEIGHALGLDHPGDYNADPNNPPTYAANAVYWQDTRMFSVMSYFGSSNTGGSLPGFASGPQLHDIAAIQRLYGANMNTHTGDTVYGFNSNTGEAHFSITSGSQGAVFSIWDAGGNDTLDLSGYSTNSNIDLRPESFSSAGPGDASSQISTDALYNISIARGVTIENAIGGSGADTITGNDVNNQLTGNGGDDAISGGLGIDTANYSSASTSDSWHRNPDGSWTVVAGAEGTDTLSSVEFLHFTDRTVHLDNAFRTFSGDGTSDILFRSSSGDIVSWNVQGSTLTQASYITSASVSQWTPLGSGDFDGDGRADMLWRQSDGLIYGWKMNGPTIVAGAGITGIGPEWTYLNTGDFNGDGHDDIAWRRSDGIVFTWDMNSPTSIASAGAIVGLGAEWSLQGVGDFNGDGRDDFLWRNTAGQTFIWEMNDRTISTAGATSAQVGTDWHVAGIGDFNGDGRDDILWQNSSGLVASWQMNGESVTGATFYGSVPAEWHIAQVGDYNGDGHDDILFKNDNGVIAVWMLDGTQIIGSGAIAGVGPEWGII